MSDVIAWEASGGVEKCWLSSQARFNPTVAEICMGQNQFLLPRKCFKEHPTLSPYQEVWKVREIRFEQKTLLHHVLHSNVCPASLFGQKVLYCKSVSYTASYHLPLLSSLYAGDLYLKHIDFQVNKAFCFFFIPTLTSMDSHVIFQISLCSE